MTKIMPEHLARGAFVYVRQSTADQLLHNHESRHRQYGLADRAHQLGWHEVIVIDEDLGRSGSGVSRPGFELLLAAICEGRAGAVFAIEASRLCRTLSSASRPGCHKTPEAWARLPSGRQAWSPPSFRRIPFGPAS